MSRNHNAHMLIPSDLWQRAKERAELEGLNMTEMVCRGLELALAKKGKLKR